MSGPEDVFAGVDRISVVQEPDSRSTPEFRAGWQKGYGAARATFESRAFHAAAPPVERYDEIMRRMLAAEQWAIEHVCAAAPPVEPDAAWDEEAAAYARGEVPGDREEAANWPVPPPDPVAGLREAEAVDAAWVVPGPCYDAKEHERQSVAGTHLPEPHCPFCFFESFSDPEERAEVWYARLTDPGATDDD